MANKFAVIGLGRFGSSVAITLANKGAEVLAIDINEEKVEDLRDDVAFAVALDSTDIKALKAQNIHEMDAVVVAIGKGFESMLLTTVHLMNMNLKRLIARAMTQTQRTILEKIGIKEIISPEIEVGISLAQKLLNPSLLNFLQLPDDYEIVEINAPPNIADRTIENIDLRKRYHLNLITVKRQDKKVKDGKTQIKQSIVGVPKPDTKILSSDTLIIMGKDKDIKRFVEVNH